MVKDVYYGKTLRKSFARHEEILDMPNLLEVQKNSYQWFLDTGLREVFKDVASITDYAGNLELSFIDYSMDEPPKYSVEECKARDATYAAPIKVRVRLRNKETEEIKEQEIFMGDFPLMTKAGTFVINGAERVIVSQIVRSPGIYYSHTEDKAGGITYATTVIPYRGAWLEYETDLNDAFYVRIDKNRKLPITCLIRAVGPKTDPEILELFGEDPRIVATLEKDACKTYEDALLEIYRKLRPGEPPTVDSAESLLNALFFDPRRYDLSAVGRYKFNKKLSIWTRLVNQTLAAPVADRPARSSPSPARCSPVSGPTSWTTRASTRLYWSSTACRSKYSPITWWICPSSWTLIRRSAASVRRYASPCSRSCSRITPARSSRRP